MDPSIWKVLSADGLQKDDILMYLVMLLSLISALLVFFCCCCFIFALAFGMFVGQSSMYD